MLPGKRNLITDVAGLRVGNAQDDRLKSGVTALVCEEGTVAAVDVMGGAPGTRETDLLSPENSVETVDALVLAGGSAFGLDAASGVQAWLRQHGRGLEVGGQRIPLVPAAIVFDMINGGDKNWGLYPPYREMGFAAAEAAAADFAIGSAGGGCGAFAGGLKGGLGSASTVLDNGITIGALVVVNSVGSTVMGDSRHFWAAPFEMDNEFGGLGLPATMPANAAEVRLKYRDMATAYANTTIAIVATDAKLSKAETKRLAVCAHDGLARAIWPVHTPADGDLVYGLATGRRELDRKDPSQFIDLCAVASSTLSRAIARGVFAATPAEGDIFPTWQTRFGS